jgi:hypothetical protein
VTATRPPTSSSPTRPSPTTPGALLCPRCGNALADEQGWCLECGLAARTRVHPPPNWRVPVLATVVALALLAAGIAVALVALLGNGNTAAPAGTTITVPAGTPGVTATVPAPGAAAPAVPSTTGAVVPPAGATAPGAVTPPAGTATPGATTTTPGAATTTPGAAAPGGATTPRDSTAAGKGGGKPLVLKLGDKTVTLPAGGATTTPTK